MSGDLVKVLNRENEDYEEMFNGDIIKIPAKSSIEMNRKTAAHFLGAFNSKTDKRTGMPVTKNLEIVDIKSDVKIPEKEEFICNFDGMKFDSKDELELHLKSHAENAVKDEDAEKRINRKVGTK